MSARTFAVFLAVVAVVALLAFGLIKKNEEAIAVGDDAPTPALTDLKTGDEASLDDYRGKWVLVNFWSSWCDPCRVESPDLQEFQDAHARDGVVVVGLNIEDETEKARAFVDEFKLTYPQLRAADNADTKDAYGLTARPENYLIDPDGRIAFVWRGPVTDKILAERVTPLIEDEPAPDHL